MFRVLFCINGIIIFFRFSQFDEFVISFNIVPCYCFSHTKIITSALLFFIRQHNNAISFWKFDREETKTNVTSMFFLCFSLLLDSNEWKKSKMTLILLFSFYTITIHDKKLNKMLSRCCVLFECKRHVYICSLACKKVNNKPNNGYPLLYFLFHCISLIYYLNVKMHNTSSRWKLKKKLNFLCFLLFSWNFQFYFITLIYNKFLYLVSSTPLLSYLLAHYNS